MRIARRLGLSVSVAALFLTFGSLTSGAYEYPPPPTGPVVDVGSAPVVVVGTAGKTQSYWLESRRLIYTDTLFRVESVQRGDPKTEIIVRSWGGALDSGLVQITEHQPSFKPGQTSRLFLEPVPGEAGTYTVFGGEEGKQDAAESGAAEAVTQCESGTAGDGYCLGGVRWPSNSLPTGYHVNPNTPDVSGEESAVTAAFDTWEGLTTSNIDFTFHGGTGRACSAYDDTRAVYWSIVDCSLCVGNYLACTTRWSAGVDLVHFDVEFNDNYSWALGAVTGKYDIQSVALHEAGHVLGLDHPIDCSLVMANGCLLAGTTKRTLASGDQRGAQVLYPVDNTLVKGSSASIYAIRNNTGNVPWKRPMANPLTFEANFGVSGWGNILNTTDALLNAFGTGHALINAASDGYLLIGSPTGGTVYVMQSGLRRPIAGAGVIDQCYGWDAIATVSDSVLNTYSTGATLYGPPCPFLIPPQGHLIKSVSNGTVYVMDGGQKRTIVSAGVFNACGYNWGNISTLADSYLPDIPTGANLTGPPCPQP